MTGDTINIKTHYVSLAREITELMHGKIKDHNGAFTFAIGGESGSGKSTLGLALKSVLQNEGYRTFIFHLDDYFYLPPKDTHDKRLQDITSVGPEEVNLKLLQEHIQRIKDGAKYLKKPLASYRENEIYEVVAEVGDVDVIIVEGTYALLLDDIDCRIFMLRNYLETYEHRVSRGRDPVVPFYEEILEIEHNIVKDHAALADIVIDKNYQISVNSSKVKESGYT